MANDRQLPIVIQSSQISADQTGMSFVLARVNYDDETVDPSGSNAARTDGGDLRYYKNDDQTGQMDADIVSFEHDSSTGADDADVETWVQENTLVLSATADTTIYCEYGDGALTGIADGAAFGRNAVWSDYLGRYHGDDLSVDVTGNGHTITLAGSPTAGTGPYGATTIFNGTTQDGQTGSDYNTEANYTLMVAFALVADNAVSFQRVAEIGGAGTNDGGATLQRDSGDDFWQGVVWNGASAKVITENAWPATGVYQWHAITTDQSTPMAEYFVDGVSKGTNNGSVERSVTELSIASNHGGSLSNIEVQGVSIFDGLEATTRLLAQFKNQSAPGTFAVAGTPINIGGAPTGNPWNYYAQMA